jgi:hypothetical protein
MPMKSKRTILVLFFVALLAWQCGVNTTDVLLSPDFNRRIDQTSVLSSLTKQFKFCRGDFIDKRSDTTMLGSYKREMYDYKFRSKQSLANLIFKGLETLLLNSGQQWLEPNAADIRIDLRLLNTNTETNASMSGKYHVGLQIRLDFIDNRTAEVIYFGIYKATDSESNSVGEGFDNAMIQCINLVGQDTDLRRALAKLN